MTIYGYTVDIVAKLFILFACGVPNDSSALAATRIFPYSLHIHEYIMTKLGFTSYSFIFYVLSRYKRIE